MTPDHSFQGLLSITLHFQPQWSSLHKFPEKQHGLLLSKAPALGQMMKAWFSILLSGAYTNVLGRASSRKRR